MAKAIVSNGKLQNNKRFFWDRITGNLLLSAEITVMMKNEKRIGLVYNICPPENVKNELMSMPPDSIFTLLLWYR